MTSNDDVQRPTHSASSSISLSSTLLDDQDEDVQIAIRALGDMRNGVVSKKSCAFISSVLAEIISENTFLFASFLAFFSVGSSLEFI